MEPTPQSEVDQRQAAIGGVHGRQDVQVLGQREALLRVWQPHLTLPVLQQGHHLAEHRSQVRPVELIDDQDTRRRGLSDDVRAEPLQHPRRHVVGQLLAVGVDLRSQSLDEVLVGE